MYRRRRKSEDSEEMDLCESDEEDNNHKRTSKRQVRKGNLKNRGKQSSEED